MNVIVKNKTSSQTGKDVQDASLAFLDLLYKYLERRGNHARFLFVIFPSFNTIKPSVLVHKITEGFGVTLNMAAWMLNFLTNRCEC